MLIFHKIKSLVKLILHYLKENYYLTLYHIMVPINVKRIRKKKKINIVFLVMNLSMWKYDRLYNLLLEDQRFNPIIVLAPRLNQNTEGRIFDVKQMLNYFKPRGYQVIIGYDKDSEHTFDLKSLEPDIFFYTQPQLVKLALSFKFWYIHFPKVLVAHVPYDYKITAYKADYDLLLHNVAWRLYYPNEAHKDDAFRLSRIKAKNVVVTGYPMEDEYKRKFEKDPWGEDKRKRIIWAPHHSVNSSDDLDFSTFLEVSELMRTLAVTFCESCIFAFKPHPILKSKLYDRLDWGKAKTEEYYAFWANSSNTMLQEGYYVDLFLYSDALIHDCSSFTVEYLYTKKPVMYLNNKMHNLSCFGQEAYRTHYIPSSFDEIKDFIENVVIRNEDPLKEKRQTFYNRYLISSNHHTASENIYTDMNRSLSC